MVHAKTSPFSPETYAQVERAIAALAAASGAKPLSVAGAATVNARLTALLAGDWPRVLAAALVVVLVVVAVGARGVRWALVAAVPLACGILWTGGLMGLAGSAISVMSVAVAPLVLGIGVDDGVHLLHAWRRSTGRLETVYAETGVAIVATTVTTVAAFGSLAFSRTPALVQFGWQAVAGLVACLLASLFLIPPVLGLFAGRASDSGSERGGSAHE